MEGEPDGTARVRRALRIAAALAGCVAAAPSLAIPFAYDTGSPDGRMAMASRPGSGSAVEIEAADDFYTLSTTSITSATFTGLLSGSATGADITAIVVEIYRTFPADSTNPPSGNVPTRIGSPGDVADASRDSGSSGLSFSCATLDASFTASNSVLDGIHPSPNQRTGGEGAVTGMEIECTVNFATPFLLAADHYFFVPQVGLDTGQFFWLSAAASPLASDEQAWMRNANLAPDWLRVGTDIVGGSSAPKFNGAFSLTGEARTGNSVPEPATPALLLVAASAFALSRRRPAASLATLRGRRSR
ncbi:MAG: PEP-CTERM sorting domain-containing protein [Candidatus Levyibacteriota bacterium]